MFDSLKNLSQLGPMLAQARQMQQKMEDLKARLPQLRATGTAGGTLVTAVASGSLEIVSLTFAPQALTTDPELLADLTRGAVNQALKNAQELAANEMQQIMGALGGPGGMDPQMLKGLMGP